MNRETLSKVLFVTGIGILVGWANWYLSDYILERYVAMGSFLLVGAIHYHQTYSKSAKSKQCCIDQKRGESKGSPL